MSVDPDTLAEAVEGLRRYEVTLKESPELQTIAAAARAVLEAPTAEWCETHGISAIQTVTLVKHGEKVCYAAAYSGDMIYDEFDKPARSNCRFGRVRLVAEEEK